MVAVNVALLIVAFVGYMFAVGDIYDKYKGITVLFLGAYPTSAVKAWRGTSVTIILVFFFLSLWGHRWYKAKIDVRQDHDVAIDDSIPENSQVTFKTKYYHRIISICLCGVMCFVQGVVVWGIEKGLGAKTGEVASVAISVLTTVAHMIWTAGVNFLTEFEKHDSLTGKRNWGFSKLLLLKLTNVVVIYFVKQLVLQNTINAGTDECTCPLRQMGYQFFYLLVSDMTVGNIGGVLTARFGWKVRMCLNRFKDVKQGDNALKDEFDVAQEHVGLLYRQFLILLGTFVFPLLTLFAVFANLLDLYFDKLRLVKYCKRPLRQERPLSSKTVLTYHMLIVLLCVLMPPNGLIWILRGVFTGVFMDSCNVLHPYAPRPC